VECNDRVAAVLRDFLKRKIVWERPSPTDAHQCGTSRPGRYLRITRSAFSNASAWRMKNEIGRMRVVDGPFVVVAEELDAGQIAEPLDAVLRQLREGAFQRGLAQPLRLRGQEGRWPLSSCCITPDQASAPLAHRRPGYSLSGCTPAEPDSASPSNVILSQ
jgi:hypothetical protein